jgi:hypothetical protein
MASCLLWVTRGMSEELYYFRSVPANHRPSPEFISATWQLVWSTATSQSLLLHFTTPERKHTAHDRDHIGSFSWSCGVFTDKPHQHGGVSSTANL